MSSKARATAATASCSRLRRRSERDDCSDRPRDPRRRLLLGHAGPAAPLSGRDLDAGRLYGRRRGQRDLPQSRNHAEAIEIVFDPRTITYRRLLELFFQIHDPTTLNRQGNDVGASYRSAIFYTSDEQKRIADDTIADVDASGLWPGKVVTEVTPAGAFWEAEPEHQNYLERYPNGYTCHFIRPGWRLPSRVEARRAG
jgi:peptide-methionine (S)-S-oxide reductase